MNCTSSACGGKQKYNPASSSSSKRQKGSFSIQYGDGSNVAGPIYADTVTVGGVRATNQYFSPVNTISSSFASQNVDGILGMAYPAISSLGSVWFPAFHCLPEVFAKAHARPPSSTPRGHKAQ